MASLKSLILIIVLLSTFYLVNANLYHEIFLNYKNGSLTSEEINVIYSRFDLVNFYSEDWNTPNYLIKLIDKSGNEIYVEDISVPNIQAFDISNNSDYITGGGVIQLDEVNFNIYLPYSSEAIQIIIYSLTGEKVLEEEFNNLQYNSEKLNSIEEEKGADSQKSMSNNFFFYLTLILLVLLIISILLYFLIKRVKSS
jgi:hypothetical protein